MLRGIVAAVAIAVGLLFAVPVVWGIVTLFAMAWGVIFDDVRRAIRHLRGASR